MKGNLHDVVDSSGRESADGCKELVGTETTGLNDVVSTRSLCDQHVTVGTYCRDHLCPCMAGQRDCTLPDRPGTSLHEEDAPIHSSGYVYSAMSGDSWNAQAGSLLEREVAWKVDRLLCRKHDVLRSGTERAIALRTETPDALTHAR